MRTTQEVLDCIEAETGIRPSDPWLTLRGLRRDVTPTKTIKGGNLVVNLYSEGDVHKLIAGIQSRKWFPPGAPGRPRRSP